jgi:hypothetical protein
LAPGAVSTVPVVAMAAMATHVSNRHRRRETMEAMLFLGSIGVETCWPSHANRGDCISIAAIRRADTRERGSR